MGYFFQVSTVLNLTQYNVSFMCISSSPYILHHSIRGRKIQRGECKDTDIASLALTEYITEGNLPNDSDSISSLGTNQIYITD